MQRTLTDNRFLIFPFLTLLILLLLIPAAAALPNGTETIITPGTAGSFQWNPAISGDVIAWDDQRAGGGMNIVYAYNLVTGREYPVLPDPSNPYLWQFAPSVRGDWIVWQQDDYVTYSIVAYNNATLETISIPAVPRNADWYGYLTEPSDNVMPRTNGTAVVWQDYTNNPYWGVYLYDLSAGSGGSAEPIIADPAFDQKSPDISGDYIVYENWSSGDSDIYLYFGSNRTSVQVSASPDDDLSPAVDGHRIVWQRYNTTSGYHAVYSHDILTGETRQVTPQGSPFSQTRPGISGDLVVVEDGRNVTAQQIYAYDLSLSPPREIWVTPDSEMMKKNPAISGNRVVWEDYRNSPLGNDADIYLSTLGPAEICPAADFSITPSAADPGDTVLFSAAAAQPGASPISHVLWNFGDGSPEELSGDLTATHQYAGDGVYAVTLIVENPECRTISAETCSHEVFVNSPPVADFTLNPEYGLAPLTVQFTDTSCGAPLTWAWDFGDGSTSHGQNPTHIYSIPGKDYTVSLTVNNTRGAFGTSTETKQVRTFMGGQDTATLPIDGITVDDRFGDKFLTFNSDLVPVYSPEPPAFPLTVHPPPEYGWDTIRFTGSDSIGISPSGTNVTYFGNSSRIFLTTRDVIATTSGSVPDIGTNWGANYLINTTAYPKTASLKTEVWEGATPENRVDIDTVAVRATVPVLVRDIAYTVNITKQGFTHEGEEKINMSVGHSWAASAHRLYIIGTGLDSQGNKIGALIPARHLFQAGDLDYYEGDIPEVASFLTTFALVNVEGSYNPLQLITLTVTSHVPEPAPSSEPYSDTESDGPAVGTGAGAGKAVVPVITTAATTAPTTVPTADPGTSAKIYSNGNGIVTQATRLRSADGLVTVVIGEGVVAQDAGGSPLAEITIRVLPQGSLPAVPAGSVFTFAGMAYEILPDGATFSPPLSLSFTIPQARWGQEYSVKTWDTRSGTWQDLPSVFDGSTGTITAEVSHLCTFALFAQPVAAPPTPVATPLPAVVTTLPAAAPPPSTAVSTFASMLAWATDLIVNNAVILAVVLVLVIAVYLVWQRRSPGAGQ